MIDREAIKESLAKSEEGLENLRNVHTRRYDQVQGGYLTKDLGDAVIQILNCQQETNRLIGDAIVALQKDIGVTKNLLNKVLDDD
jgi:hypothetical protein